MKAGGEELPSSPPGTEMSRCDWSAGTPGARRAVQNTGPTFARSPRSLVQLLAVVFVVVALCRVAQVREAVQVVLALGAGAVLQDARGVVSLVAVRHQRVRRPGDGAQLNRYD